MYQEVQCDFPPGVDGPALLERLQQVLDPELDESILHLGFIRSLTARDGNATVVLQLPTSWCAANFVYLMAEDIRQALLTAEGINRVTIRLGDHFAAEVIEAALNAGKPFNEAFPGEGCGSLTPLRATFLQKGFTSRQARLLRDLRAAGFSTHSICALRIGDLVAQDGVYLVRQASHEPIRVGPVETLHQYLSRRAKLGLPCDSLAPLITDPQGQPIAAGQLEAYYHTARTARVSLEANSSFCRALLAARQAQPLILGDAINVMKSGG